MTNYEKITRRLGELIRRGEEVLGTKWKSSMSSMRVNDQKFRDWIMATSSFLTNVFSEGSVYLKQISSDPKYAYYNDALKVQAVLKALKEDIDGGLLLNIEEIVAADIFTDFLEMAEHLLENGYKDPAASLVGAVLEDGLRKIAKKNDIEIKSRGNISSLNKKLADSDIYNRIIQREIHAWNELRDQADHGHFDEYDEKQVSKMLEFVRDFLGKYL